jgi:hypothetical protein
MPIRLRNLSRAYDIVKTLLHKWKKEVLLQDFLME